MELTKIAVDIQEELDEQWLRNIGKLFSKYRRVFKLFGSIAKEDLKLIDDILRTKPRTIGTQGGKGIVKNIDEFESLLKKGKINPDDLGRLGWEILRNGDNASPALRKEIINGWIKQPQTLTKYGNLTADQFGSLLKSTNYKNGGHAISSASVRKEMMEAFKEAFPESVVAKQFPGTTKAAASAATKGSKSSATAKKDPWWKSKKVKTVGDALTDNAEIKSPSISKRVLQALSWKWVWALVKMGGLVVVGSWGIRKFKKLVKETTGQDVDQLQIGLPTCMFRLLHREGALLESTASVDGDPVVYLRKTGMPELDAVGGVRLYIDHAIRTADNNKTGTWDCLLQPTPLSEEKSLSDIFEELLLEDILNEEVLFEDRAARQARSIDRAIRSAVTYMQDDIDKKDLKTLYKRLNGLKKVTYNGKPALGEVMDIYKRQTQNDLINDVQYQQNLGAEQSRYRDSILSLLQGAETQSGSKISGPLSDIISIKWDNEPVPSEPAAQKGSEQPSDQTTKPEQQTTKPATRQSKYQLSPDFPVKFGYYNPDIRKMQMCLGMEDKYQTGNFGPITYAKLTEMGYELPEKSITKELYNDIISKCGKVSQQRKPIENMPIEKISPKIELPQITPLTKPQTQQLKPMLSQSIPIARQKEILDNIRRNKKYVGPPLNDAESKWLQGVMAKQGKPTIEKAKEKTTFGK